MEFWKSVVIFFHWRLFIGSLKTILKAVLLLSTLGPIKYKFYLLK